MERFAGSRRTCTRHRRVLRGFTLIELVVVVVILSLLASVAIPRFAGAVSRRRVDSATYRIESDLAWVQQRARAASRSKTIQFDSVTRSYTLPDMADIDRPGSDYTVHLDRMPYELEAVRVNLGGDGKLVFNGFGLPDSGGLIVVGAGGHAMAVSVDPDTGRTQRYVCEVDAGELDPGTVKILDLARVTLVDPNDGQIVPATEVLP